LLIDDNSVNQLVLRGMLLKLGYRVRTADCANTAIEQMKNQKFDAVLLDCHSPMSDGAVVCSRLREMPNAKDIPVLGIIATLERGDRDRYLAAGMTECMHRPVRFEELQSLLYSWLLAHKQSEQVGG
jgi:CheY-like chemotaxis protein